MQIKEAFSVLGTTENGISDVEAKKRLERFGKNEISRSKKESKLVMFFKQFADLMIIILLVSAVISAVIAIVQKDYSDLVDVGVILLIVLLNAIIGFVQEDKAEASLEKLKKDSEPFVKVIRDGTVCKVLVEDVTIGDVVLLEAGDVACADIFLIESASLKCDESSLTGESAEVEKRAGEALKRDTPVGDRYNIVHSNSVITYGRAKGIVTRVGENTELGKIASLLGGQKAETTPLQKKLAWLGKFITIGVLCIAVIIFVINVLIDPAHDVIKPLMLAIAIAVAAIPESLPAVITIIMALGVSRMSKQNAIVKKLHAVETLGSCQIICSDKTGTLTKNKMQVQSVFTGGKLLNSISMFDVTSNFHFVNATSLCNDCILKKNEIVGDPTEVALVEFAEHFGQTKTELDKRFKRVAELPFDSNRKLMTTFNQVEDKIIAYTKGAPDVLLSRCKQIFENGNISKLTDEKISEIEKTISKMASKGLRVLGFAFKTHSGEKYSFDDEENLVFLGLCGMRDPPRESTLQAVRLCKSSGMMPIMITGDHALTAKQIAKEVGIWTKNSKILTGKELDALSDAKFRKIIKDVTVYARVSPENKVRIVETWKSLGKVVAMTGDGVNDAPSIKRADIGVGMGISGTEVTKSVADMVLVDDDFATIVIAVKEGRRIYQNIQKVVQFLFGTNFVEVLSLFLVTLIFPSMTFLIPIQILFINLVTDSLPAIALSIEKSEKDIMDRPPRDKKENIFAGGIWQSMAVQIVTQTVLVILTFAISLSISGNNQYATTMAFLVLSISQLVHILNVRTSHSIFSSNPFTNWILWLSIIVGVGLNILLVSVPVLASVFGLVCVGITDWLIVLALSLIIIPVMEIFKVFKTLKTNKKSKGK